MNIHIMAPDGRARVRPDTTLNRFKEDYYVPDGVKRIGFSPVVFAHISKAGKALSPRFIKRYYSALGFGMVICPDGEEFYDFTSLLSMEEIPPSELDNGANHLLVFCNGLKVCDIGGTDFRTLAERAIVSCSSHSSLRIGDFVAAEIADNGRSESKNKRELRPENTPVDTLVDKCAGETTVRMQFGDRLLFETKFSF